MPALTRIALLLCLSACDTFAAPAPQPRTQQTPPPPISRPPTLIAPPPTLGAAGCIGCVVSVLIDAGARRCPGTGFQFGQDADGLSIALEQDAGLDPCKLDTDADGCNDAAELYLLGCDDARNAVLEPHCFSGMTKTEVSYMLPTNAGPWSEVTLRFPKDVALGVSALEATPSGAGAVSGDKFTKVQPGATLRFELVLQETTSELERGTLRVIADGQSIATGKLLVTPLPECPNPI